MSLRERLIAAVNTKLEESIESSKEILSNNIVPSFDEMGMASVEPGEFAQGEITDQENLVNKANMSNDNDFGGSSEGNGKSLSGAVDDMMKDLVDISASNSEDEGSASVEIVKTTSEDDCENKEHCHHHFGESKMAKFVEKALGGKSCEEYLMSLTEAGDYAGPKDFVPDTRINVSEVLNTLKHEIGEGSEAIHVDQIYDERNNNAYRVSQIDKNKLPKKLQVQNVILELDDDVYRVNKVSESFPLEK